MSNDELLATFVAIAIAQANAHLSSKSATRSAAAVNRLYKPFMAVCDEFRRRGPDVRRLLIPLLDYTSPPPNRVDDRALQIRLNAARELRAVVPDRARSTLEAISQRDLPQGLEAGMALLYVDEGIFKPS